MKRVKIYKVLTPSHWHKTKQADGYRQHNSRIEPQFIEFEFEFEANLIHNNKIFLKIYHKKEFWGENNWGGITLIGLERLKNYRAVPLQEEKIAQFGREREGFGCRERNQSGQARLVFAPIKNRITCEPEQLPVLWIQKKGVCQRLLGRAFELFGWVLRKIQWPFGLRVHIFCFTFSAFFFFFVRIC